MRLNIQISGIEYLKEAPFCFTEIIRNNEDEADQEKEAETVFDLDEEIKKKALCEAKKNARALLLEVT